MKTSHTIPLYRSSMRAWILWMLCACSWNIHAQNWTPSKPIRFIIPQVAGGGADTIGRVIAQGLSDKLGHPVIADNKPGTNGGVGVDALMHSPNDGHHLLLVFTSLMAITPAVYTKLNYDAMRDLKVLGSLCEVPLVMIANTALDVNNLNEFLSYAKTHPNASFGASSGNGSFSHLLLEMLKVKTGVSMTHVPFKGEAPAVQYVLSNQGPMIYIGTPSPIIGPVQTARLKALGVTTLNRMEQLPNVPTLSEQGLKDFNESFWYGLAVSSSTPPHIVAALNASVSELSQSNALIQSLSRVGCSSLALNASEFNERVKLDINKYGAIAKSVGMKVD
ncbi:MAG: tripartite tricarboxylate transporter substrate binding protein [Betaproteobacteria bacterium]|jgi:tripartite-type tricarboxylate transporter receptor subunit TctC